MGGFVTAGLTGPLVTVGLGGEEAVIVIPPVVAKRIPGGGLQFRRRVKGIKLTQEKEIIILRSVLEKSELPLRLIEEIRMDKITKIKLLKLLEIAIKSTTHITAFFIKTVGGKSTLLEKRMLIKSNKTSILNRFLKIVDKSLEIFEHRVIKKDKDTQLLNTTDLIDDVEKANILDILDKLEDDDATPI